MAKQEKQIKLINNMAAGAVGLTMPDGKTNVLRQPGAYRMCSKEEVWHIFNSCKTIQRGHVFVDDKDFVNELNGLDVSIEDDNKLNLNTLSKDELKQVVKSNNVAELKKLFAADENLSDGTKEKIAIIAREEYKENGMDAKKVKLIETLTGLAVMVDEEEDK